jgi:precorrin-6B methylase 1
MLLCHWSPKAHVHLITENTFSLSPGLPKTLIVPHYSKVQVQISKFPQRLNENSAVNLYKNQKKKLHNSKIQQHKAIITTPKGRDRDTKRKN